MVREAINMHNWKEQVYRKYGQGVDRKLFESLRAHDVFDLDLTDYRWRKDDGSETTATWITNAGQPITWLADTNVRIRFVVKESGAGTLAGTLTSQSVGSGTGSLQYRKNGGTWTEVTTSSSNVIISASANITDNESTTQQISSGTFVAGKLKDAGAGWNVSLSGDDGTEIEYCIQVVDADTANGDLIELRLVGEETNGTPFTDYTIVGGAIRVYSLLGSLSASDLSILRQGAYIGPFETSSRKYIPVPDLGDNIQMVSTTAANPTDGQWAALHVPLFNDTAGIACMGADMDASGYIHVCWQSLNGDIRYGRFDTSTNEWDKIEFVSAFTGTYDTLPTHGNYTVAVCLFGATPTPGIVFLGNSTSFALDTAFMKRRTGDFSWAASAIFSNSLTVEAVSSLGTGSDDRAYVQVQTPSAVWVANFDSTGWVHNPGVSIDTIVSGSDNVCMASRPPTSGTFSGQPVGFYIDSTGKASCRFVNPGSTITNDNSYTDLSDNNVYGHNRLSIPFAIGCAAVNGGDLHFMYSHGTDQDIYRDKFDESSWGTDSEEVDAVTCNFISCRKGFGNEILFVYLNASTETFGKFSIAGPSDIPVPLTGRKINTLLRM